MHIKPAGGGWAQPCARVHLMGLMNTENHAAQHALRHCPVCQIAR